MCAKGKGTQRLGSELGEQPLQGHLHFKRGPLSGADSKQQGGLVSWEQDMAGSCGEEGRTSMLLPSRCCTEKHHCLSKTPDPVSKTALASRGRGFCCLLTALLRGRWGGRGGCRARGGGRHRRAGGAAGLAAAVLHTSFGIPLITGSFTFEQRVKDKHPVNLERVMVGCFGIQLRARGGGGDGKTHWGPHHHIPAHVGARRRERLSQK